MSGRNVLFKKVYLSILYFAVVTSSCSGSDLNAKQLTCGKKGLSVTQHALPNSPCPEQHHRRAVLHEVSADTCEKASRPFVA